MNGPTEISDAAKRMSDIVNGITVAQPWEVRTRSWLAFRLEDGESDGELYDSLPDARNHQADEKLCCYLTLRSAINGMDPKEAQVFLDFHRMAYDAGFRMTDPDAPTSQQRTLVMPLPREELSRQMKRLMDRSGKSISRYRDEN